MQTNASSEEVNRLELFTFDKNKKQFIRQSHTKIKLTKECDQLMDFQ